MRQGTNYNNINGLKTRFKEKTYLKYFDGRA